MSSIQVGNIVKFKNADFTLGVVTAINKVNVVWVLDDFGFSETYPIDVLETTGRYIDIKGLLKQIF